MTMTMTMTTRCAFLWTLATAVAACGANADDGDDEVGDAPGSPDAGPDAAPIEADAGGDPTMGALVGHVTRTVEPMNGGQGDLLIAVFTKDPISDQANAMVVAQARLADVDMTSPTASIAYEVVDIPPRAEPYFVIAFLDDNHTTSSTDPTTARPDKGDLVSLNGIAVPKVTVAAPGGVAHDIALTIAMPF